MNDQLKAELKALIDEARNAKLETGEIKKSLEAEIEKLRSESNSRIDAVEAKTSRPPIGATEVKTIGQTVTDSDGFKGMKSNGLYSSGKVNIESFHTKAIVNATGASQPLVPAFRTSEIIANPDRILTVRNLLPSGPVSSNMVEFPKENVFTNSAAPQYSSPAFENVAKAESGITFTLGTAPVRTIAHWIAASRQVLEDAPMLQSYINKRLVYGLKLAEEAQLLTGDGTGGHVSGLITNATAYDTNLNVSGDTYIDKLRHAIYQVAASEYSASGIVVNPKDWHTLELIKSSGAGADGQYIFANPHLAGVPQIWGLPVVATNSMTEGKFLVGAFDLAAQIWDRMDSTVEVATQHSDYFTKNMVAILAEERLALAIYRPLSFVYGSF